MGLTDILRRDTEVSFPEFVLLKASAGTGKTHALTLRFTQFLLSERIKNNDFRQILAITFTRNAAKEMKNRIIQWLKDCYFGQEKTLSQFQEIIDLDKELLANKAQETLENLLSRYSDFQVMTIDSFMAEIFRASAIDLNISPDFEISLNPTPLIDYAFYRFLRKVTPESPEGKRLVEISASLQELNKSESAFKWDPTEDIKKKFYEFYNRLEAMNRRPCLKINPNELKAAEARVRSAAAKIEEIVNQHELVFGKKSVFAQLLPKIKSGFVSDLLDKNWERIPINRPDSKNPQQMNGYKLAEKAWEEFKEALQFYKLIYSRQFFYPYLQTYNDLISYLTEVKKEKNLVLLEDISRELATYLTQGIVPDVYFRLGDRIFHFLIDEFQDTSPLQWFNLRPLIENSLAQGGSLFIVGDTKQAIYGFREADYEIMMKLERESEFFPSAQVEVRELNINRRSRRKILEFVKKIFPEGVKRLEEYKDKAAESGLDNFTMIASAEKEDHPGHVEIEFFPAESKPSSFQENNDNAVENGEEIDQMTLVKNKVQNLILSLKERGYDYSDIAVLTYKNESVIKIAAWLNEKNIPFIPFSALDIRERKIIKEVLALLHFLDFPPDDLSLVTFLLGDLFEKEMSSFFSASPYPSLHDFILSCRQKKEYPLYPIFRQQYPDIWNHYFEPLFKTVGYLPLYDLTAQIYRLFNIFENFPEEEASLARLLEVIKEFEGRGKNNLREFLLFSKEEEADETLWTIDVTAEIEAVRIMTIHKAKGLGFPVVILLLFPEVSPSPTFYLQEQKETAYPPEFYVLKINKGIASSCPELKSIYENHNTKEIINRLNTLYVALTRASDELYIIGVQGKRKFYPLNLFEKLNLHSDPEYQPDQPKPPVKCEKAKRRETGLEILKLAEPVIIPSVKKTFSRSEELNRGEIVHALLASIEYLEDNWQENLKKLANNLKSIGKSPQLVDEAMNLVVRFFSQFSFSDYFQPKPGRKIYREMEMVSRKGELFRADRIIFDQNLITVIDFKTGFSDEYLKYFYRQQIKNYLAILEEIYPQKKSIGLIIYLDEQFWEKVE
ncbi:MAG: UvrD-helicase domain-containing protein [Candidatus Aminicenantes bacterium]|nr:UvrD-helicase domain-containing protein [Candidatus Aminicenantes bacterium]